MRTLRAITPALVLVLAAAGCGGPEQDPGTVVDGVAQKVNGTTKKVTVPTGFVLVTFGTPKTHLTWKEAGDLDSHDADPGTAYVAVHTDFEHDPMRDEPAAPRTTTIHSLTDGVKTRLDQPYKVDGMATTPHASTVFVVVKKGQPLYINITYKGAKTQTVTFHP